MSIRDHRKRIRERCIGAQERRVFLVEGRDDQAAWRVMLDRFCPGWERDSCVAAAGNKRQVIDILSLEQDWLGLVDGDEWDEATIRQRQQEQTNLLVLPRFCLENYLCDPSELWESLPPVKQDRIDGGRQALAERLAGDLDRFVRHGVLWKTITPLWTGLRARGFKDALASENSLHAAQDDDLIRRRLADWHRFLDPGSVFDEFQRTLEQAASEPDHAKFTCWVHGKLFWTTQVHPVLNQLLGQASAADRKNDLFSTMPRPTDLEPILRQLCPRDSA